MHPITKIKIPDFMDRDRTSMVDATCTIIYAAIPMALNYLLNYGSALISMYFICTHHTIQLLTFPARPSPTLLSGLSLPTYSCFMSSSTLLQGLPSFVLTLPKIKKRKSVCFIRKLWELPFWYAWSWPLWSTSWTEYCIFLGMVSMKICRLCCHLICLQLYLGNRAFILPLFVYRYQQKLPSLARRHLSAHCYSPLCSHGSPNSVDHLPLYWWAFGYFGGCLDQKYHRHVMCLGSLFLHHHQRAYKIIVDWVVPEIDKQHRKIRQRGHAPPILHIHGISMFSGALRGCQSRVNSLNHCALYLCFHVLHHLLHLHQSHSVPQPLFGYQHLIKLVETMQEKNISGDRSITSFIDSSHHEHHTLSGILRLHVHRRRSSGHCRNIQRHLYLLRDHLHFEHEYYYARNRQDFGTWVSVGLLLCFLLPHGNHPWSHALLLLLVRIVGHLDRLAYGFVGRVDSQLEKTAVSWFWRGFYHD